MGIEIEHEFDHTITPLAHSGAMQLDAIRNTLAKANRVELQDKSLRRAAVVIAMITEHESDQASHFLLTRRATKLRQHSGQFALPGGKVDAGETIKQAALRELEEELGLELSENEVIGLLDDYPTRSGFCITPVVVWGGKPDRIQANPDEVAKVFHIPLHDLATENLINHYQGEHPDRPVLSVNLATVGHEVYAPTAAIIYQFSEWVVQGNNTRVAFYDEPRFAWR